MKQIIEYQRESLAQIKESIGGNNDVVDKTGIKEIIDTAYDFDDMVENEIEYELEKKHGLHNEKGN